MVLERCSMIHIEILSKVEFQTRSFSFSILDGCFLDLMKIDIKTYVLTTHNFETYVITSTD